MDVIFNKLTQVSRFIIYLMAASVLMSCAHNAQDRDALIASTNSALKTQNTAASDATSISINQIGASSKTLSPPQILSRSSGQSQLTVEQLRSFADRCLPDSQLPPPAGLDCSDISLRMQRLLKEDDTVIDALITLGQLGRHDNLARTIDDLNDGRSGNSLAGGAIAGGLINGSPPPPTPELAPDLEDFLEENGLNINQGLISNQSQ